MSEKTAVRNRITPTAPFILEIKDVQGTQQQSLLVSFDLNAFAAFEEITGTSLLANVEAIIGNPSVTQLTALLWAGLQDQQDDYKGLVGLRNLRHNLTLPQFAAAKQACLEAFLSQLPAEREAALRAVLNGEKPVADPLANPAA